jgi:hypothetical protein
MITTESEETVQEAGEKRMVGAGATTEDEE